MNIDNFIPSLLKITASENLNIENDLNSTSKNLNELLNEKENNQTKVKNNQEKNQENNQENC